MNKRQLIEKLWLSIADRLPPDEPLVTVITYNAATGYIAGWPASVAREYAQSVLNTQGKIPEGWSWDRQFTHWFLPYPPDGKKTYAEHCSAQKPGNKAKKNRGALL